MTEENIEYVNPETENFADDEPIKTDGYTELAETFHVINGGCDSAMKVRFADSLPDAPNYVTIRNTDSKTEIYYTGKDLETNTLTGCVFESGDSVIYQPKTVDEEGKVTNPGSEVLYDLYDIYPTLKAIYHIVGITLQQQAELMFVALGKNEKIEKWNSAEPIIPEEGEEPTKDRRWTDPETGDVEILPYETYGKMAERYNFNYGKHYVGPANGWYYE